MKTNKILCALTFMIFLLAELKRTDADALECGTYNKFNFEEIVSDNTCSPSEIIAKRKALHNLEQLLISLEDVSCINDGCIPNSCQLSLTFVDGYTQTSSYDALSGCWTATAMVSGEVMMTCSACDPL